MQDILFKNNNKNIVKKLSNRSYKKNKGRNNIAIIAIILTTMMFTTLFVITESQTKNVIEMYFYKSGYDSHISMKDNITDEIFEKISSHPDVAQAGRSIVLGLGENTELIGQQLEIRFADENFAKHSFALPTVGNMPKNIDEIALSDLTLDRLNIPHEIGQKISLKWRDDFFSNEVLEKEFILSGYWEGNSVGYAQMAWVNEEFVLNQINHIEKKEENQFRGMRNIDVNLYSDKDLENTMDKILSDLNLSELKYGVNLAYDEGIKIMSFQESIPLYLSMILVFIAGFLIIYNIFQISIISDIQFYGKLKTLGTTQRQIKKLIYKQGNKLSLIGIPIGLIIGYLFGMVLVPKVLGEYGSSVAFNPIIFIGSGLFAWITVFISCLKPAKLAGNVSPIEALKYSEGDSLSKSKSKNSKHGASPITMSLRDMGRNKKRTITMILSLTLALVVLSMLYAKNASFDVEVYLSDMVISDFIIMDATTEDYINKYNSKGNTISTELKDIVNNLEGLESKGELYSEEIILPIGENAINNMESFYNNNGRLESMKEDKYWTNAYKEALETKKSGSVIFGGDKLIIDELIKANNWVEGEFDAEKFETGNYLIAIGVSDDSGDHMPTYSVGQKIIIENKEYEIMGIIKQVIPIFSGADSSYFSLDFIMPSVEFKGIWPDNTIRKLFFNVDDEYINTTENILINYQKNIDNSMPYTSRQSKIDMIEGETRSKFIMGNALSLVLALVGILNFLNSMITSIISRKKEFAMMQSIGMTKNQLRRLLITEGLTYISITLILSYAISSFGIGVILRNTAIMSGGFTSYKFTLLPLIICTPILLLIAVIIPYIAFKNIESESVVERLATT